MNRLEEVVAVFDVHFLRNVGAEDCIARNIRLPQELEKFTDYGGGTDEKHCGCNVFHRMTGEVPIDEGMLNSAGADSVIKPERDG